MTDAEVQAALTAEVPKGRANDNEGPFSLGQNVWPGLSKLLEESGEVVQVCGKLVATGGRVDHWSGLNLGHALEEELGDLLASILFVVNHNEAINARTVQARKSAKLALFEKWHQAASAGHEPA